MSRHKPPTIAETPSSINSTPPQPCAPIHYRDTQGFTGRTSQPKATSPNPPHLQCAAPSLTQPGLSISSAPPTPMLTGASQSHRQLSPAPPAPRPSRAPHQFRRATQ
ncbi:hypothetical protein M0R45_037315 [Rubus argutus]|uniref:Uncharacterized protein n=1 Tax=Rubus argutus TaxID=59490 RepID=A0AAW1W092_RUBAR